MPAPKYRLEALLRVKTKEKDRAAVLLARAIERLRVEREKEKKLVEEKKKIVERWKEKRAEMKAATDSGLIISHGNRFVSYLRKLKEDEEEKQKEIDEQKEVVSEAVESVAKARRYYIDAVKEHQKMTKHKELWQKKIRNELNKKEEREFDELANTIHEIRRWKGERSEFTV